MRFEKVNVPEGVSGDWSVSKFTVDPEDAKLFNLRCLMSGSIDAGRRMPAGDYTRLTCKGRGVIMSDTPAEERENKWLWWEATGDVLINGLGLGFVLKAICQRDEVKSVTVIEKEQDVINLVGDSVDKEKVTIVHADALEWRPEKGQRFDVVWHDIWDDICLDNKPEMSRLHRCYGSRCDLQNSWSKSYLEQMQREDRQRSNWYG